MIRVECTNCGTKLNAKDSLAGTTRNCPKCHAPIDIPAVEPDPKASDEPTPIIFSNPAAERLPTKKFIDRLSRTNRYLICDKTMIVAIWRSDGQGWMVRGASGFLPARRNSESLPHFGDFILVELEMDQTDEGLRLAAVNSYELNPRFALTKLDKGDDEILQTIINYGALTREQKFAVRHALTEEFLREVWGDSKEALDYLSNADYHSHTSRPSEE